MVTEERIRNNVIFQQYRIPTKVHLHLQRYRYIPYVVATEVYEFCVYQVLQMYDVKCLLDVPFGKGYVEVNEMFYSIIEKLNLKYKNRLRAE